MSVLSIIILAFSFALSEMVLAKRCAEAHPIRLTRGLLATVLVTAIHAVLFWVGCRIGNGIRFRSPSNETLYADYNAYLFLGLSVVVGLRQLWPYLRREPKLPVFDWGHTATVLALAAASGMNQLLVGLGAGMAGAAQRGTLMPLLTLFGLEWAFGYMGLMLGRRKVPMRPRRWIIVASLLLIGVAVAATVNAS